MRKLFTSIIALATFLGASPALAIDNAWITSPTLSAVSITGGGASATGVGYALSTQAQTATFKFKGTQAQAGKYAQINFFDFVGGVGLELVSGPDGVSSTACDHQTLGGNNHTCFFKLDANSNASFPLLLSNVTSAGHFKYKVLAGPNITESADGILSFVTPTNKIAPVLLNVRGIAGGPGATQFRVTNYGKASAGVRVKFTFTGVGENLSALNAVSDKNGLVTVYLTNQKFYKGSAKVTARVIGGHAKAVSYIWWFKVKYL
ncbi:MAG: hypothetical protein RLZZ380_1004 [Actinomycetota bacterium]|jgi:hypothetical protein